VKEKELNLTDCVCVCGGESKERVLVSLPLFVLLVSGSCGSFHETERERESRWNTHIGKLFLSW
jgi:hypothetical protein